MKKRMFLFSILVATLIFSLLFIVADQHEEDEEIDPIDKAYQCLQDSVDDETCSELSLEEKIFSLLAIKECKDELIDDSEKDSDDNEKCWPEAGACDIKDTAQAILALDNVNYNTQEAEDWLISKNRTPTDMEWFLQIESPNEEDPYSCSITYSGSASGYDITVGGDKKINQNAGSCLTLAQDDYWLQIDESCYDEEFEVSCGVDFLTSLLFKEEDSSTIHVSDKTNRASPGGTTKEKVKSLCFGLGSSCDYVGSLWAAFVLDVKEYDVSSYLPYLITMTDEDENEKYLPESFLHIITGGNSEDFREDLLAKQKNNKYWDESRNKYYDTSVALLPFQTGSDQPPAKDNSKEWLLDEDVQEEDGCWNGGNIRDTAFVLYSIFYGEGSFSRGSGGGGGGDVGDDDIDNDCEGSNYYCMSGASCTGGLLDGYSGCGVLKCCDKVAEQEESCSEMNGEICNSNQNCLGSRSLEEYTPDLGTGQTCCVGGYCGIQTIDDPEEDGKDCESYAGGTCRSNGCNDDEEEDSSYACDYSGDSCCIESGGTGIVPKKSYVWIWVLLFLIILLILGIIFRDKLRPYWFKIKSQLGKLRGGRGGLGGRRPRFPFPPPMRPGRMPPGRIMPRRILPPQRDAVRRPPMPPTTPASSGRKQPGELDDVLKKLKEMGK